jgi:DNA replication protein DnaC
MRDEQALYLHRQRVLREHQKTMEAIYQKVPGLIRLDQEIARLRKEIISRMLSTYKGLGADSELPTLEDALTQVVTARGNLLREYNVNEGDLKPEWDCPHCEDTGRIYVDEDKIKLCSCRDQQKGAWRQHLAGLPPRLEGSTFARVNYELYRESERSQVRKIFNYVEKYCNSLNPGSKGHGLFIHGSTGSGKSWLLGCIANRLSPVMSVKYMVFADFLDTLRATFSGSGHTSEQELIEYVKQADLLLLDDLGVEKASEFSLKYLAQIIDYRYRSLKPVVVTSNFTLEELRNRTQSDLYGERIIWRLIETCDILNLQGNIRLHL